jgi:hypothetical protein
MSPAASSGRNESLVTYELRQTLRRYYAAQRAIPIARKRTAQQRRPTTSFSPFTKG